MIATRIALTALLLLLCSSSLYAQVTTLNTIPRYPAIRTQFNQTLSQTLTNEQRLELFRQTVTQGRYSGRPMLMRMFGNFEPGPFNLSSATQGLSTTVRLLASDNPNVVIGNARTLRYAMGLQGDGRFQVIGLNRPRLNSIGKTDADTVFRHQVTGLQGRMEVKNMSLSSQRANLPKIQKQILKMVQDARLTGEIQIWGNRQNVLPEIWTFAAQHGITVVERLRTGNTNLHPEDIGFRAFADGLDKQFHVQAKLIAMAGSVRLGMGAYMVYQASRQLANDLADFGRGQGDWVRLGEHALIFVAGSGLTVAGSAQLAHQIPSLANSARLVSLTKWSGRIEVVGAVLAEGFLVTQYMSGDVTERQFWYGQASLGGGLVGGAAGGFVGLKAGAVLGADIGSLVAPGPGTAIGAAIGGTIGAIGGGIGGGYVGAHFAGRGAESLYRFQDREQQERYAKFLLRHYQSS